MHIKTYATILLLFAPLWISTPVLSTAQSKEFLTKEEIKKIQQAREVDKRTKILLKAAEARLDMLEFRFSGQEAAEGNPLEFFTAEDLLDGFFRIMKSIMANIEDAAGDYRQDPLKLNKSLAMLKNSTEQFGRKLDWFKKSMEENKLGDTWRLLIRASEINRGAQEGATNALAGGN